MESTVEVFLLSGAELQEVHIATAAASNMFFIYDSLNACDITAVKTMP
jgi:hypothetical protein